MDINYKSLSREYAVQLDAEDPLREFRSSFSIPLVKDVKSKVHDPSKAPPHEAHADSGHEESSEEAVYLCGNSLGLMPKRTRQLVNEELDVWSESGVHGHFHHRFGRQWVSTDVDNVNGPMERIVGAKSGSNEVSIMNSLTVNLHLLMISFYRPTKQRFKILMEAKAFPSDQYAIESQLQLHGYSSESGALIELAPRAGEYCLRTEDILNVIEREGDAVALILMSGVQYYTGQLFDMEKITAAGHRKGCLVGFDLAHAVGNAVLKLHEWNVDFAVWCTYKYLNSGPGSIGGAFIHEKNHQDKSLRKLCGWWGHNADTRFQMGPEFDAIPGPLGYRMSNPCVLAVTSLKASLDIFDQTSMQKLNEKTLKLTGYLEFLLSETFRLHDALKAPFQIVTPSDVRQRGCQLSLIFKQNVKGIFQGLMDHGIVCDKREPDCIRIAPAPFYNSFLDVWKFVDILKLVIVSGK